MVFSRSRLKHKGTNREQSVRIQNTGGLSTKEVERMRQEAEMYADEDNRRIKLIELKNQADALFSYKSTLKDNRDLISETSRRRQRRN